MTPPNAPTAAEPMTTEEENLRVAVAYVERFLDQRCTHHAENCPVPHAAWLTIQSALLAARRERETAYETTAQVRDALSEEILKLRDHLAAARREHETALLHLRTLAAHARGEPTDAMALNKAMRAAAHGEDR